MSVFLDTNVLVYADDADGGEKTQIARDLIRSAMRRRTGVVSTQVLQEYFVIARKKLKLDGAAARARLEVYSTLQVVPVGTSTILAAVDLHRLHQISFWDALVVRAAEQAGCDTLYTEDLQAGRAFGPIRIVNPFPGGQKVSKLAWTDVLELFTPAEQRAIRDVVTHLKVRAGAPEPAGGGAGAVAPEIRITLPGVTLGFVPSKGDSGHHAFVDAGPDHRPRVLELCEAVLGVPAADVPDAKQFVTFPMSRLEPRHAPSGLATVVLRFAR